MTTLSGIFGGMLLAIDGERGRCLCSYSCRNRSSLFGPDAYDDISSCMRMASMKLERHCAERMSVYTVLREPLILQSSFIVITIEADIM